MEDLSKETKSVIESFMKSMAAEARLLELLCTAIDTDMSREEIRSNLAEHKVRIIKTVAALQEIIL